MVDYLHDFPSFLEGLSLRPSAFTEEEAEAVISLPFWRDFH